MCGCENPEIYAQVSNIQFREMLPFKYKQAFQNQSLE